MIMNILSCTLRGESFRINVVSHERLNQLMQTQRHPKERQKAHWMTCIVMPGQNRK